MINIEEILQAAEYFEEKEHQKYEESKIGVLRVGSCGAVLPNGDIIGTCPRSAMLRCLGVSESKDTKSHICTKAGTLFEQEVARLLKVAGQEIKQEDEIGVQFKTKLGRLVTGRPDVVIMNDENPQVVIDVKGVLSHSTASKTTYGDAPKKLDQLIQITLYSKLLGIPGILLFWNGSYYQPSYPDKKKYGIQGNIEPYRKYFKVFLDSDEHVCYYDIDGGREPYKTIIRFPYISEYYNLVDQCIVAGILPPKVTSVDEFGNKVYSICTFCKFKEACKEKLGYTDFVIRCKELVT